MRKPHQIPLGSRIGRWTILGRLGRGAVATVYLAEDVSTRAQVALKALHHDPEDTHGHAVSRLRREIKLASRVDHAGVCKPLALYEEEDLVLLAMQYVPGWSLQELLDKERHLDTINSVRIIRAVCSALAATHALDILHRDLKPGNIMIRPNGAPTVLDFGYAVAPDVTRVTQSGTWVGTLVYAAPELLKNSPATTLSDIYSLGVILYQCLTGGLPFVGKTYGEIASAVLYKDPRPPRARVPEIDMQLEAIVLRAIARDPQQRFASVIELDEALAVFDAATESGENRIATLDRARTGNPAPEPTATDIQAVDVPMPAMRSAEPTETSIPAPEPTQPGVLLPGAEPDEALPPTASAEVTTPSTPVNAVEDSLRIRQRLSELSAALVRERHDKGLIAGDSEALDALEKNAEQHLSQGHMTDTIDLLRQALEAAQAVAVDKGFVASKIERLDQTLGERGAARRATRCRPFLEQARSALEAGDFASANRALNQGFALLKTT